MPAVKVRCPRCQSAYSVDESVAGRKLRCNKAGCGQTFRMGGTETNSAPSPPASPRGAPQAPGDGVPLTWEPGDVILDLYEVRPFDEKTPFIEGGMGRVNCVWHRGWNTLLAVKSLHPGKLTSATAVENFKREAEVWVDRLGLHPHVVSCHYVRVLGGLPRLFMEFVPGGSLEDWIGSGKLYESGPERTLERILDTAIQFAWGLHHAHEQGLIHQDVKPANVLMTPEGVVRVTDFGLARARGETSERRERRDGSTVMATWGGMTPSYCSPEQAEIEARRAAGAPAEQWPKLTRGTDIWSWAVSVLEMFTGRVAWPSGSVAGHYLEHDADDPRIPRMPPAVVELLERCLQQRPPDRPRNLLEVADTLRLIYRQITGQPHEREQPEPDEALADSLNNRAISLFDLDRKEEAEQKWQEALGADPHHPEATCNLGLIRWRSARLTAEELLRTLREASTSSADPARFDYLGGLIHLERADAEAALESLTRAHKARIGGTEVVSALELAKADIARRFPRSFEKPSDIEADFDRILDFKAHAAPVTAVAFGPDGCVVFSASTDGAMQLWEVSTGDLLRSFLAKDSGVMAIDSAALSPDGRLVLLGGDITVVRLKLQLWDITTGRCLRTFEGHMGTVNAVAFSPNGRLAVSGSSDNTLRLWEVSTGRCLHTFWNNWSVSTVAFGPDGRTVLSGSPNDEARLWLIPEEFQGQTPLTARPAPPPGRLPSWPSLKGHGGWVHSVAFSPTAELALTGSADRTVRLWETSSARCLCTLEGHTEGVRAVAFSPDGRFALSGSEDGTLRLWEVASGRCLRSFKGYTKRVTAVAFSPDGRLALWGGEDGTLHMCSVALAGYRAPLATSRPSTTDHRAYRRLFNQAREAIIQGDTEAAVSLLQQARQEPGCARRTDALELARQLSRRVAHRAFAGGWECRSVTAHAGELTSVAFSPDGRLALSGAKDGTMRSWEVPSLRCLLSFEGHTGEVTSVAWSFDGGFALSASRDHTVRLWEVSSARSLSVFKGHAGEVLSVALSADGQFALSGSWDRTARLWEVSSGRCLRTFKGHEAGVTSVALSPDGRLALSGCVDRASRLWEVSSGHCVRTFGEHKGWVTTVAFSSDGGRFLSGSLDHTLRLWNVSSNVSLRSFVGHTDVVLSGALSFDGRFVFSGSQDRTVRLWEAASGRCLRLLEGHTGEVTSVALGPDARYALSGDRNQLLRLWELDWDFEPNRPADWDDGARPYLTSFLTLHTPCPGRVSWFWPTSAGTTHALTRQGKPAWTEDDCRRLLDALGCAGYGWLRPEGVRRELERMAAEWKGPPALT